MSEPEGAAEVPTTEETPPNEAAAAVEEASAEPKTTTSDAAEGELVEVSEGTIIIGESVVEEEAQVTVASTSSGGEDVGKVASPEKITASPVTSPVKVVTPTLVSVSGATPPKDNVIFVVNKVDSPAGGEMKLLSKPLTVLGSPVAGGATAVLNKGSIVGNTIVKVQKVGSPQGSPILAKKSVVLASRTGGVNQLIACSPGTVVQQAGGSGAPVVLTQKVASSSIITSPVVSAGRLATTTISSLGGGAKMLSTANISPQQPQSQQRVQDVRVDNWGNYCLQRLQGMFEKEEYCDLTLRFHSSQEIKVHRVVVNLCTEYFSNLEKLYGLTDGTLTLPKDVDFQTMQTIIKFFYTGKLEVRGNQFGDIYKTVKMMNITILIKLLEAHSRKPAAAQGKKDGTQVGRTAVVLKQAGEQGPTGQVQIVAGSNQAGSGSPVLTKAIHVGGPGGVKLPPGVKTKTVLARVQNQPGKAGQTTKPASKKLPIWKERKFTPVVQEPPKLEKWKIKEEEPARPTRFEWGDPDEFDPFFNPPTLTNHALMEKQKEKHSTTPRKAEDIFDSVKSLQTSGTKRQAEPEVSSPSTEPPPAKIPKIVESSTLIVPDLSAANNETANDRSASTATTNEDPVGADSAHVSLFEDPAESMTIPMLVENTPAETKPTPILKPALKSSIKAKDGTSPKTVRFAPEVEKESTPSTVTTPVVTTTTDNAITTTTTALTAASSPTPTATATLTPTDTTTLTPTATTSPTPTTSATPVKPKAIPIVLPSSSEGDAMTNHSKLISEVLKKFPDLVKDNKNIKLKIMTKSADGSSAGTSKDAKSKVSYIVLKSGSSSDATSSATVLRKSPAQSSVSKFWERDKTPKKPSPAENTTGPWSCEKCGVDENTALQFETYYDFRRHLVDVHAERIDARICEYCGQRASKRNLLLYHLYTKHGVQPPKNCTFPHCDQCDYVALSESLLNKHKQNHDANKEYCCTVCNASFKTNTALQAHMTADLHRNKDQIYECPYCRKPFVRNINLKAHIRSLHRDVARMEEMEDPKLPPDETLLARKIISGFNKKRGFPSILTTARASSSTAGLVEFISPDSFTQGISYVTADGQPIEILDASTLTSLPLTLVSSGEDGMAAIATTTPVTTAITIDGQTATTSATTTEYVTSVHQPEASQQPVFIMDNAQQTGAAVEVDMANVGLTLAPDGTMVYEGDDPNFIIQDMQGNQFRKITGIDENGKPVVFLQMIGEVNQVGISETVIDESSLSMDTSGSGQIFVSSAGIPISVSNAAGDQQQVIFTSAPGGGTILEMVQADGSGSNQVVMSHAVINSQDGVQIDESQQQHIQLVHHNESTEQIQEVSHQSNSMGQPVQELHIVLDQADSSNKQSVSEVQDDNVEQQQEGVEIVEIQQTETESYTELQIADQYQGDGTEMEVSDANVAEQNTQVIQEMETQQMEVDDENSQQLQIDEGPAAGDPRGVKMERTETQVISEVQEEEENDNNEQEDTQVVSEDLQESIELVEGQTLTFIEDEDGTQRIQVEEGNVEEIST